LLSGRRAVAVIDQNLSVGKGGILFAEIASAFRARQAPPMLSFIGGLGGRRFRSEEFDQILAALQAAPHDGGSPQPHLLFTATEYERVREMLHIAHGGTTDPVLPPGASTAVRG
jgi:pyruvate ferredoxin oxidoreductase alpha subunit